MPICLLPYVLLVTAGDALDYRYSVQERVEHPIEDLALAQPFLLRHLLALVQVAADGEGSVTGSGNDGDAP